MKVTLLSLSKLATVYAIRILAACLKKEGHDVQIIFLLKTFRRRYNDRVLEEIAELSKGSGLIGVSVMTNYFENAVQVTQMLKKQLNIPIIWGGIHAIVRPEECLDYADIVCTGEGEEVLVELARKMENGQDFYNTEGVSFRDNKRIIRNKLRPLIQDLDSVPFPDYDYENHYLLISAYRDKDCFAQNDEHICKMDKDLLKKYTMDGGYLTLPTRGCPFGCTFCCNNTFNRMYSGQKIVRKRSIENIIGELIEVKQRLPFMKLINFSDDCFFTYSAEEIKEFCARYKEEIGLPLTVNGLTPSTFTKEKVSLLVNAGMTGIRMGIETASERTKRLYKRNYSNQQVEKAVRAINEYKDKIKLPRYDFILDNPWESEDDLIETLRFTAKLPTPYVLGRFSLTFYPGTYLYEMAKRDGIIKDDLTDVYRKPYRGHKKTYLNRLFDLLYLYALLGDTISPKIMFMLTDERLRRLKISKLLYLILQIRILPFFISIKIGRFKNLLYLTLQDLRRRDLSRIIRKIMYRSV